MEFTKSLSEVLELEIKLRHKNIKQFSEKSGIAYMTISSVLKRGVENTTVSTLKKICDALGITINHLFDKQKIYTINDKLVKYRSDYTNEELIDDMIELGLINLKKKRYTDSQLENIANSFRFAVLQDPTVDIF